MIKYILFLNDSAQIHNSTGLVAKCSSWAMIDLLVYKTFSFAYSTCYMRTVREEIEFVIQCQKYREENVLDMPDFVYAWQFTSYLNSDVTSLSAGWRKYLGLALFTNRKSQGKLYFDGLRHLSDTLISVFFQNLARCNDDLVILAEYETGLLASQHLVPLYDHGDRLSLHKWQSHFIHDNHETNYA
jgi:hypothetical protein